MLMKKIIHYMTLFVILLFTNCLTASCIKDDYTVTDGTSTINLYFSTRSDEADTGDTQETTIPVGTNEGIKTLRVFITDENGKVQCNIYQDYSNDSQGNNAVKTFTIMGVPVGTKNFYVIANEASVGLTKNDLDNRQMVDEDFLNTVITNPSSPSVAYFPRMRNQINELGLPITGMRTDVLVEGEKLDLEIPITHAVAKIVFKVKNTLSENITLTGFSLGEFFADQTYLFPSATGQLTGVNYAPFGGTVNHTFTAGAAEAEYFTCYLYETPEDRKSYFTVKLLSDLGLEEKPVTISDYVVKRNTVINIVATISKETSVIVPKIDWQVSPWNPVTNNVPSFN